MTWNELIAWINTLTPEQRETDVSVLLSDQGEIFPVTYTGINEENGENLFVQLDINHPYIGV